MTVRELQTTPLRTHWEGCEEVHPECKQPEQEESEAVRAAWMAGYIEGEREAIENQPVQQQEPVAWLVQYSNKHEFVWGQKPQWIADAIGIEPLYTTPQPRTWVGLTDEEKSELDAEYGDDTLAHLDAIEAKLKEKNRG